MRYKTKLDLLGGLAGVLIGCGVAWLTYVITTALLPFFSP